MTTLGHSTIKRRDDKGKPYGYKKKHNKDTDYDSRTGKYPRLFHAIADWIQQGRDVLKTRLEHMNLFPEKNWFVADVDTTKGGIILMQALKASVLRSGSDRNSDALRLILRNSYVAKRDKNLLTQKNCSQQRLILWALRDELNRAKGKSLHLLCAETED